MVSFAAPGSGCGDRDFLWRQRFSMGLTIFSAADLKRQFPLGDIQVTTGVIGVWSTLV